MKKIAFILGLMVSWSASYAQMKTPQPSPMSKIEQTVGLTTFNIEYSRPGVKNRTIFGDLVPYGKLWRTGANKAVQFSFDTDIKVEGKKVEAGDYALFTIPNKDSWEVMLYKETEIWGTPDSWMDSMEACRFKVNTIALKDAVESFTIGFNGVSDGESAVISISWENTEVEFKVEVPTSEIAVESIKNAMAGPSAADYYRAASYYAEIGKDLDTALDWINKACDIRGEEAYWYFRRKSLIQAELGQYKEAITTAEISMQNAEKSGNQDYVKMNKDSIAEWTKKK